MIRKCNKHTIEEMQKIAEQRNGKCISKKYINAKIKIEWKCNICNNKWKAIFDSILRGSWCPYCAGKYRTIEDMKLLAEKQGGACLSANYINCKTKLKWKCGKGHVWYATPANMVRGTWCPHCIGRYKTIEDMQQIALDQGGWCLSTRYINNHTELWWQCAKGHIWDAVPSSIQQGSWCPVCGGSKRLTIEDMHKLAKKRKGKCLSIRYSNAYKKLKWQCAKGHIWKATSGSVRHGSWCPVCNEIEKTKRITAHRLTIVEFNKIAKQHGGECMSDEYVNNCTKLKFKCAKGHIWNALPTNIKKGVWCPICSQSKEERTCRKIFEDLFCKKFPKKRPKWLVNPNSGWRLELDGYCKELGLAFEYNGEQHYNSKNPFFRKNRTLEYQQQLDKIKRKLCYKNNVTLITIPYFIRHKDLSTYITGELS